MKFFYIDLSVTAHCLVAEETRCSTSLRIELIMQSKIFSLDDIQFT
jgi:hypothetical protein